MTNDIDDFEFENILGKTIEGVVVTKSIAGSKLRRVELIFDDSTSYEIWSNNSLWLQGASRLNIGDFNAVLERIESDEGMEIVSCVGKKNIL